MKRLLAVPAALALALSLAACGSGDSDSDAGSGGEVNTVDTKFGEVEVPADAKRVVALGWGDAETALALGVQPVGASDWLAFGGEGVGPWAKGMYDKAPKIIETLEPDYEAIAALEPDVILDTKSSGDKARYDRLSSIAPTVGVPEGGDNYITTTEQQVDMISEALGLDDKGDEVLDGIEKEFADAAAAHPEFKGKSVVAAAYTSEGWGAYVEDTERVEFLEDLGFELSPEIAKEETDEFSIDISSENLDRLDADVLVVFPIYVDAAEITKQAAYQALPVVKDRRAVLLSDPDISSAYSLGSPLSVSYAIENVVPLLATAAGGKG